MFLPHITIRVKRKGNHNWQAEVVIHAFQPKKNRLGRVLEPISPVAAYQTLYVTSEPVGWSTYEGAAWAAVRAARAWIRHNRAAQMSMARKVENARIESGYYVAQLASDLYENVEARAAALAIHEARATKNYAAERKAETKLQVSIEKFLVADKRQESAFSTMYTVLDLWLKWDAEGSRAVQG